MKRVTLPFKEPNRGRVHWGEVFANLSVGSMDLLALYLRQTRGAIHPCVAKRLALLLDGRPKETGFRISIGKHPEIGTRRPGREEKVLSQKFAGDVAFFMAKQLVANPGAYKRALAATAAHFAISERTVQSYWPSWKETALLRARALAKYAPQD